MSESASFEAGFTLPTVRRETPGVWLGRRGHKEGRSDRRGCLRRELDISNLNTQREWTGVDFSQYYVCMALVLPQYILNIRTLIFTFCSQ